MRILADCLLVSSSPLSKVARLPTLENCQNTLGVFNVGAWLEAYMS